MNTLRAEAIGWAATLRLRTRWPVSAVGCRRAPPLHRRRPAAHPAPVSRLCSYVLCEAALQAKKKENRDGSAEQWRCTAAADENNGC